MLNRLAGGSRGIGSRHLREREHDDGNEVRDHRWWGTTVAEWQRRAWLLCDAHQGFEWVTVMMFRGYVNFGVPQRKT